MPILELAPGHRLHYLDLQPEGSPAVLLLHGLGATCESWYFQFPALTAAGLRLLAPDGRGFGKSTCPDGRGDIASAAGDFARLVEALGAGPLHIVGISMGGTHALQLALDYPHLVRKLVLVNTFSHFRPTRLSSWLFFALRYLLVHTLGLETQAKAVARRLFPGPERESLRAAYIQQVTQADPRGYRAAMRALATFNVSHRLHEIKAPTLVITGENDATIHPLSQAHLAQSIPGARQVVIPNAGHAVIADRPEQFNAALVEFLCA